MEQISLRTHARLQPLHTVTITGGLWAHRQQINREVSLQHGYDMLDAAGNFHNLRLAAGQISGDLRGLRFMDSDLYKWLEAISYELERAPDSRLQRFADETIALLAAAQTSDGYLNSHYQIATPHQRWADIRDGHELYCAGHLFEAAAAHHQATGRTDLLTVARRFADYIDTVFGPGKRAATPGHPEIELALVRLYHLTGEPRYLRLAAFFVDQRGQNLLQAPNPDYYQDNTPVRQQAQVVGHAVRALYLNAGVTDLYMESGEQALLDAMLAQWSDMTTSKLYITGGAGARHEGESFGAPYELPNDRAYAETCAAIASIFWNWRLLQITGEPRFADLIERTLYNGFLSGVSLDGHGYFYVNPLSSQGGYSRQPWYVCACCPPNVMRLLASIHRYFVTQDSSGLQIHQYAPMTITSHQIRLRVETNYPWNGQVSLVIEETPGAEWTLQLRIPAWCQGARLEINDDKQPAAPVASSYLALSRAWRPGDRVTLHLPMTPRLTAAHPLIDSTRGCAAIEYGPLVYCLEQIDHDQPVETLHLTPHTTLQTHWQPDFLGGAVQITADGQSVSHSDWQNELYRPAGISLADRQPATISALPYHLWGSRDTGAMRVWIPYSSTSDGG
jgi:DUF1680 family protein